MAIYTSRYANKELRNEGYYPVGISIGTPKYALGYTEEEDWTYLTKLFGSNAIPASSAEIITKAIKKAEKEGMVTTKNRWEWIVNMASEYLEGK